MNNYKVEELFVVKNIELGTYILNDMSYTDDIDEAKTFKSIKVLRAFVRRADYVPKTHLILKVKTYYKAKLENNLIAEVI